MPTHHSAKDEAALRKLIDDQIAAIAAHDLDGIMRAYAEDVVVFNSLMPYQTTGRGDFRLAWKDCLQYFPDNCKTEMRDYTVAVDGDVGMAHWLWRFTGFQEHHPALITWLRCSQGYRRRNGKWEVIHEHSSVPFDQATGEAQFTNNV